jgi:hypothetical protein
VVWIQKLISNKTEHYKFWNDKIIETILHVRSRHLTILGVLAPTEGREQLSEDCYERYGRYRIY